MQESIASFEQVKLNVLVVLLLLLYCQLVALQTEMQVPILCATINSTSRNFHCIDFHFPRLPLEVWLLLPTNLHSPATTTSGFFLKHYCCRLNSQLSSALTTAILIPDAHCRKLPRLLAKNFAPMGQIQRLATMAIGGHLFIPLQQKLEFSRIVKRSL